MILPALLLTLNEYSSWRVGRVVPMIPSAVTIPLSVVSRDTIFQKAAMVLEVWVEVGSSFLQKGTERGAVTWI